ncbi:type II toxin-antitoxin system PemK/MazF family toxin [Aliivibrio salmonicida]|uniref:type II toxin-antitoxin system PemK/MazF family toxin n=1 Tax=Aliivibrio salmonicida TaxID=40269 RepID=UPI003D0A2367
MYVPEQGDIVSLDFDPSSGNEIMKRRPALVLSKKVFNEHTGFAVVTPITSTKRGSKLEVLLPKKMEVQGAVLTYQIKSLDFSTRNVKFIEKAPQSVVSRVIDIAKLIIS